MGKLIVAAARFLLLCAVLLLFLTMMRPNIALAQHPTPTMNPTQGRSPGTSIPVLGNAHQAITFLTQMITLAMQNGGAGHEAQLEALKQQIEALPKPQRGDRKAARLQHDKGLEEFKKGRYEQALQFFLTAYQLDAGDVEVVNNAGMAYLKTGNLPEAARYLGGALSLAPTRAAAWGNLAEVYAHDARLEEAVAAYALTYRYSKNKDATRRLLEAQTTNVDDPQVMQAAKAALALPLISGRTVSGEDEYRGLAEKNLGGVKEQPASTPPVPVPVPTPTPRARETVVAQLQAQEPRYQGRTLAEWQGDLRDLSPQVRERAIEALSAFGPQAVPVLIQALKDANASVRQMAAQALDRIGPSAKDAVPALTQALNDADTAVQWTAALALRRIVRATKDIVPALTRALQDRRADLGVRQSVIFTLGEIGPAPKDAVPALIEFLDVTLLRGEAIVALGKIGPAAKDAVPALRRNTRDPSGEQNQLVDEALRRIEGR